MLLGESNGPRGMDNSDDTMATVAQYQRIFQMLLGESNGPRGMDNSDDTMATVAQFVEQLHANMCSPQERESITISLLGLARSRK
ncbi:hypothetical protein AAC387_Pa03g4049 [Persea americana]